MLSLRRKNWNDSKNVSFCLSLDPVFHNAPPLTFHYLTRLIAVKITTLCCGRGSRGYRQQDPQKSVSLYSTVGVSQKSRKREKEKN